MAVAPAEAQTGMADPLDEFSTDPLTPRENQKARKIIRDQERVEWLWATGRVWGGYLAGGIGALWLGWDRLKLFLKWLAS